MSWGGYGFGGGDSDGSSGTGLSGGSAASSGGIGFGSSGFNNGPGGATGVRSGGNVGFSGGSGGGRTTTSTAPSPSVNADYGLVSPAPAAPTIQATPSTLRDSLATFAAANPWAARALAGFGAFALTGNPVAVNTAVKAAGNYADNVMTGPGLTATGWTADNPNLSASGPLAPGQNSYGMNPNATGIGLQGQGTLYGGSTGGGAASSPGAGPGPIGGSGGRGPNTGSNMTTPATGAPAPAPAMAVAPTGPDIFAQLDTIFSSFNAPAAPAPSAGGSVGGVSYGGGYSQGAQPAPTGPTGPTGPQSIDIGGYKVTATDLDKYGVMPKTAALYDSYLANSNDLYGRMDTEVNRLNSRGYIESERGRAVMGVQQQADNAYQQQMRNMGRMGVDPSSGRAMAMYNQNAMNTALAKVSAATQSDAALRSAYMTGLGGLNTMNNGRAAAAQQFGSIFNDYDKNAIANNYGMADAAAKKYGADASVSSASASASASMHNAGLTAASSRYDTDARIAQARADAAAKVYGINRTADVGMADVAARMYGYDKQADTTTSSDNKGAFAYVAGSLVNGLFS